MLTILVLHTLKVTRLIFSENPGSRSVDLLGAQQACSSNTKSVAETHQGL